MRDPKLDIGMVEEGGMKDDMRDDSGRMTVRIWVMVEEGR